MSNSQTRCDGIFVGHAIASNFDTSAWMALELSESLLELKRFDGPNILSRYLYTYHNNHYDLGETMRAAYEDFKDRIQFPTRIARTINRENLLFDRSIIEETVKAADERLNGRTAGCGPVHRSFPLALCPWIDDDDLFSISKQEAKLTHYNPLAGEVAGIVNLICRSLLKNQSWYDAVQSAFTAPGLHDEISNIQVRFTRQSTSSSTMPPAYVANALHEALHCVTNANSLAEILKQPQKKISFYSLPIIGVLSGARWGVPVDMFRDKVDNPQLKKIRETATKFSNQWPATTQNKNAKA